MSRHSLVLGDLPPLLQEEQYARLSFARAGDEFESDDEIPDLSPPPSDSEVIGRCGYCVCCNYTFLYTFRGDC